MTFRMTQTNEQNAVLTYSGGPGIKCVILTEFVVFSCSTSIQMFACYLKLGLTDPEIFHYSTYFPICFDVLLTVHLSIFISVINQLDAQNFCFTISLFHASTCFEHIARNM